MKIKRYIGVMVVLAVGLFLVNASWPETALAKVQIICPQPQQITAWSVPATAGSGTSGAVCYTPTANASACQVVRSADTPWDVLGSILRAPFEVGQCILGGACP